MVNKRLLIIRRPVYVFAISFLITTAVLVWQGERYGLQTAAVAGVTLLLALCISPLRRVPLLRIVSLAVLLAASLLYTRFFLVVRPLHALDGSTVSMTVRITELPKESSRLYRGVVIDSKALPEDTHLCISFFGADVTPERYETVTGQAQLYLPSSAQMGSLYSENIYLCAYFTEAGITGKTVPWYDRSIQSCRRTILDGMHDILPGDEGDLLAAVVLGDTSSLSDEVDNDFRNSGLSHLLVVSGLHMTILTAAIAAILRPGRLPRPLSTLLILAILWMFMLLVGFSHSVIRAGMMIHFLLIGRAFRFRADSRTSLSAALLLILLLNPYAVADVGFLLSFAATFGMIVLTPALEQIIGAIPLCRRYGWLHQALSVFCCPLAAIAFTAPILCLYFGRLTVLTPITNLLAVWPVTVLLPLAALGALAVCLPFGNGIAHGFLFCAGLLAKWVLAVARVFGRLSVATLQIRHPVSLLLLTLLPIAAFWGWKIHPRRGLRRVMAAGVVLLLTSSLFLSLFSRYTLSCRVADGEGSLTAVFETGGHTMAIVSGAKTDDFYDTRRFFSDCGVEKLDLLVITDGSPAVTASLAHLLEQYPAQTVVYSGADDLDWTAGISGIRREPVDNEATFALWDRVTVYLKDGWCRLDFGDTRLVFAPADKTAIPAGWDRAHLMVFRKTVPDNVATFATRRALMLCDPAQIHRVTTELPWGSYPIDLVSQTGSCAFVTAGKGDLTAADRYWL